MSPGNMLVRIINVAPLGSRSRSLSQLSKRALCLDKISTYILSVVVIVAAAAPQATRVRVITSTVSFAPADVVTGTHSSAFALAGSGTSLV